MIRTLLLSNVSLWGCLWQSTLFAVLGLLGSFLLRRRPARAHQVLLLAVMAAVIVPALSGVVRHFHLGLLAPQVTVAELDGPHQSGARETGAFTATSAPEAQPAPAAQSAVASPDGVSSVATRDTWRTIALWTWAAATLVLLGRLLFAFTVGVRLARRARPLSSDPVVPALSLAQARLGVNKDLQIRTDLGVRSPVIWCWDRQPVLLLPDDASGSGGGIDWTGVISHELAHWKRGDHVSGLLAELAVCALPWNPLLWLSKRRLVSLTEQACDDWVVASGQPAEDYAESLLDFQPQNRMAFVPAVVHSKRGVAARVRRILNDACGNPRPGATWAFVVSVLVACVAVGLAFAQTRPAQPPASDPNKPEQPRYPAQTFNSKLAFRVSVRETAEAQWRPFGNTPSAAPLQIPPCWGWQVSLVDPVEDWSLLAHEMSLNKIPGLVLNACTDSDLKYLADLRDMRWLVLYGTSITDAGLEHLKGLTELEMLNLGQTRITDAGLAHLRGLTALRTLYLLGGTRITDAGLAHLKDVTALRDLYLSGTRITNAGLAHLEGLTELRNLALTNARVTDAGLEHLKGLTGLESLGLTGTQVTGQGLVHLKELEIVRLDGCPITDADLAHLRSLTRLAHVGLSNTKITDAGLAYVGNLTAIESLNLAQTKVTDAGLEHLKGLTKLRELGLQGTQITGTGLEHLQGLNGLQCLWLDNTRVGDAGLAYLKGLPGLEQLSLQGVQITDAGLGHLQGLKGLQRLWLDNTRIGDAGLEHLKGLTELAMLEVPGTQITDVGLEHLKGLTKLEGLYLNRTQITDVGLKHLQGLPALRDLGLIETQVTDAGARQLKQSLPNLTVWTVQPQPTTQGTDKPAQLISAGATPVFTDNFDNGLSEKWRFTDSKTQALPAPGHGVENGQLRLSHAKALLEGIDLTDYVARARICIKESVLGSHGGFGIDARITPSLSGVKNNDYYDLVLISDSSPGLWLALSYFAVPRTQQHDVLRFTSCKVVRNQWYTLEFEVRGERLRGYLDGKLLVEATDERLTKGSIRLSAWNATALVDDFSVYPLP